MCSICGQTPCHPRCPNADDPKPAYICDMCGEGIYSGDKFYSVESKCYCLSCAQSKCGDILTAHGGKAHEADIRTCVFCLNEIHGKYITYRGNDYCEECYEDYGDELIEDIGEAETAGEPGE